MINALLINPDNTKNVLQEAIPQLCPNVSICETFWDIRFIGAYIEKYQPKLIFLETNILNLEILEIVGQISFKGIELIFVSSIKELAYEAIRLSASGFLLKPFNPIDLVSVIQNVCKKIQYEEDYILHHHLIDKLNIRLSNEDLIGIPTMEGYDFIRVKEIIRCQGLQRCTQVITTQTNKIISSYNLGEFTKILEPLSFFSPHKSHLINLNYIKSYSKDGSILMCDGSQIPVSRRRRNEFLSTIKHI